MGFLDIFKSKKSTSPPGPPDQDAPAHGWEAITGAFEALYPSQKSPPHRAPAIHRMHDLSENAAAYDGMSAYDAGDFWHFVTYGLTELYGKENEDAGVSGFGFEFTFRIPKLGESPPLWAFDFLEAIGKSVWKGAAFAPGHTIKTGPLDGRADTPLDAVLVIRDPAFPQPIESPHGRFDLLQLIGVEDSYRQKVLTAYEESDSGGWEAQVVAELQAANPDLITPIRTQGEWGEKN